MAGNMYETTGTVKQISDAQTFPSGFTKREFILSTDEEYPQPLKMECIKDRTSLLDEVKTGDRVTVRFSIRGSEYNGRHFVNLQAWRIAKSEAGDAKDKGPADDDLEPADDVESPDGMPF